MITETDIGYRFTKDTGLVTYYGGATDEGECYKDLEAWRSGKGVIYIPEHSLPCTSLDEPLWTRENWTEWVRTTIAEDRPQYATDTAFVEFIAEAILQECQWEDLATRLEEWAMHRDFPEDLDHNYEEFRKKDNK